MFKGKKEYTASARAANIIRLGESLAAQVLAAHLALAAKVDGIPEEQPYTFDGQNGKWRRTEAQNGQG